MVKHIWNCIMNTTFLKSQQFDKTVDYDFDKHRKTVDYSDQLFKDD